MASLLLSFGTPMILGGDEVLTTAFGNNNTYAQDNIYSWINWPDVGAVGHRMYELVCRLMSIRHQYTALKQDEFKEGNTLIWYRPDGVPMENEDWHGYVRALSCRVQGEKDTLFFIFNAYDKPLAWRLPVGSKWQLILDTTDEASFARGKGFSPAWSVLVFQQKDL